MQATVMNRYAVIIKPRKRKSEIILFIKSLFDVRKENPLGLDNATSARMYL